MKNQIRRILRGDICLMIGFSLVLVVFLAFILLQVNETLPSEMRLLTVGAAAFAICCYLEIVVKAALQLMKQQDVIYREELLHRGVAIENE